MGEGGGLQIQSGMIGPTSKRRVRNTKKKTSEKKKGELITLIAIKGRKDANPQ